MRRLPAVIGLVGLPLAACGGDDEAAESPETANAATTEAQSDESADETSDDGTTGEVTDDTPELDTVALRARVVSATNAASFDEPESGGIAYGSITGCPIDDHDKLLTDVFGEIVGDPPGLDRVGASITSTLDGTAVDLPISGTTLVGCASEGEGDNGVGIDLAVAPAALEAYLREFNDPESFGDVEFTVESSEAAFGGEVARAVVSARDDPTFTSREVIWFDDEVMLTAYVFGPDLVDIDLDALEASFLAAIPDLVESAFA